MPKTSLILTDEMMNRVEEYRRNVPGRIPSRNEALQSILEYGLGIVEREQRSGVHSFEKSTPAMESRNDA